MDEYSRPLRMAYQPELKKPSKPNRTNFTTSDVHEQKRRKKQQLEHHAQAQIIEAAHFFQKRNKQEITQQTEAAPNRDPEGSLTRRQTGYIHKIERQEA